MGMAVSIDVRGGDAPLSALRDVVAWLHHVDATFSTYRDDSPITGWARGELTLDELSDEIRDVLRLCDEVREDSYGAFDINAVHAPNGTQVDPSGLVKGWATERAAEMLTASGATDLCINAGGDIALRGHFAPGKPWRVGIRHPLEADRLAMVVELSGQVGLATSATYERGNHIVDPRTDAPPSGLLSATVVGPDLTFADAYATTVFVMGVDGLRWLAEHPGYEGYVITDEQMTYATDGFPPRALDE